MNEDGSLDTTDRERWIDASLSFRQMSKCAFPISLGLLIFCAGPFMYVWGPGRDDGIVWLIPLIVMGIVLHEGLHALAHVVLGKASWRDIRFGVKWRWLMPYAHCRAELPDSAHKCSCALHLIVVGLFPWIIGMLTGDRLISFFGAIFTAGAGGDILILWLIWSIPKDRIIADHAGAVGVKVSPGPGLENLETRLTWIRRIAGPREAPKAQRTTPIGKLIVTIILGAIMGNSIVANKQADFEKGQTLTLEAYTAAFESHKKNLSDDPPNMLFAIAISIGLCALLFSVYEMLGSFFGRVIQYVMDSKSANRSPPSSDAESGEPVSFAHRPPS